MYSYLKKSRVLTAFVFVMLTGHLFGEVEEPKSSYSRVVSKNGTIAHNFTYGEAIGKVLLEQNERIVAEIDGAQALSFSPDGNQLLLAEKEMSDDQRAFILNVEGEEIVVAPAAERKRFGPRYVVKVEWSPDSEYLVFYQTAAAGVAPTVEKVNE